MSNNGTLTGRVPWGSWRPCFGRAAADWQHQHAGSMQSVARLAGYVSPASALIQRNSMFGFTSRLIGAALSYRLANSEHAGARGLLAAITQRAVAGGGLKQVSIEPHGKAANAQARVCIECKCKCTCTSRWDGAAGVHVLVGRLCCRSNGRVPHAVRHPEECASGKPPPWETAISRRPLVLDDSCNHADPAAARARPRTQTTLAPRTPAAVA